MEDHTTENTATKHCSRCDRDLLATSEYFAKKSKAADGYHSWCRECVSGYDREYRRENTEKKKESDRKYRQENNATIKAWKKAHYQENKEKINVKNRENYAKNKRKYAITQRRYVEVNRETVRQYQKTYYLENKTVLDAASRENYQKNKPRIAEKARVYRFTNKEKLAVDKQRYYDMHKDQEVARAAAWSKANPEKKKQSEKNWRINNLEKQRSSVLRRRARKRGLPDNFAGEDWKRCIEYFNGCCAICGRSSGLKHTIAMDHWIPLSSPDCPGTKPGNIVPLCHGVGGCNNRKANKDPEQWLREYFGETKATNVLRSVNEYFDSLEKE